jgi:hypothetical protein
MHTLPIKAYSETVSELGLTRIETAVSLVQEDSWSLQFSVTIHPLAEGTDRTRLVLVFPAEEAYFLNHERRIVALTHEAAPPYPVGCILWLKTSGTLWQIDLPKYPYLRLCKQVNKVTAKFVIQDRFGSGLILWGEHKIRKSPFEKTIYIRANKLRSLQEAVWLEPYPNAARSVICLTDHPDYDSVSQLRLLHELFSKNNIRITKGVFPKSDPKPGYLEPGLDVPEYKTYIDLLYESGSEIAYHGLSPRLNPPSLSECLRRIEMMSSYSPKTWIDHGCGTYLFSRDAIFKEGDSLVDILSKAGVENYWSYTDIWENPVRHLDVWKHRNLLSAFSNFFSFLLDKKCVSIPLAVYYGSSILKNLLGQFHLRGVMSDPLRINAWKSVATHTRRLKKYHDNPMVFYDLNGHFSLMSNQSIWVFDTVLLNHLAFQLRPANIDLLCRQNGLLLAHCYFGHRKSRYGTMNCFVKDGDRESMIPEFAEDIKYISEKQSQKELVTLSFNALRTALTDFVSASLIRSSRGWEINGLNAIVACQQPPSVLEPNRQWSKDKLYYTAVEERALLRHGKGA